MNFGRSILALFLIAGYVLGMTNTLVPRCQNEKEHQQHILAHNIEHLHNGDVTLANTNHLGHREIDTASFYEYLHDLLDDAEHPNENCENGVFVNGVTHSIDNKLVLLDLPFDFKPLVKIELPSQRDYFNYQSPKIQSPKPVRNPLRGPPLLHV